MRETAKGHAGALRGIAEAVAAIRARQYPLCVVGGVDSYLEADTLDWLDSELMLARDGVRGGLRSNAPHPVDAPWDQDLDRGMRSKRLSWAVLVGSVVVAGCGASSSSRRATLDDGGLDGGAGGAKGTGGRSSAGGSPGAGGANGGGAGGTVGTGGTVGAGGASADAGDASLGDGSPGDGSLDSSLGGCPGLYFGTATDTVQVQSNPNFDFGDAGTMEVWLYPDTGADAGLSGDGTIMNKWVNFQEDKFIQLSQNGGIRGFFHSAGASADIAAPAGSVTPSHWTHIALVYDATATRIFVDGAKVGEGAGVLPTNSAGPLQIGHVARDVSWPPVHGFYSEVRLSKVARYTADFTPALHLAVDADTLGLWKLDEGTGTTANDASANGNSGAITGATWRRAECR